MTQLVSLPFFPLQATFPDNSLALCYPPYGPGCCALVQRSVHLQSLASPTNIPSQNLEGLVPSVLQVHWISLLWKKPLLPTAVLIHEAVSWGHKLTAKAICISVCCGEAGNWSGAQTRPRIPFQDLLSRPEQIYFLEEIHQ